MAVLFGISAVFHILQCSYYKSWKMMWLHPVCAVLFTAGFILREVASHNYIYSPTNLAIFIPSVVLIGICPPILELSNYHRVLSIFGILLAAVEAINALGVSLGANPSGTNQALGGDLSLAALSIQLVVITFFFCIAGVFHVRCASAKHNDILAGPHGRRIKTPLFTLYGSMVLILVRCIYRLVEHVSGSTAVDLRDFASLERLTPILRYEWYFYVFEAGLMCANSLLWNVFFPGRFLPESKGVSVSVDGGDEVVGGWAGEEDRVPLVAKVGTALTFGLVRFGRGKRGEEGGLWRWVLLGEED
ncbi:hypothetical protein B0T17DRAFT_636372 [Bombardia bombarda]|uniref:Uncharacterized protein n=1 Tax=Bombardia bombarda TaxID=252184 RepID=A0AA40C9S4_9PEZI|nr:hypothetical protein B0T17DRAFT_636372 [Bombardia bombarda]